MKTWEMIKELTENPDKKFKLKNTDNTNDIAVEIEVEDGVIIDLYEIDYFHVDDEWEEIKEPVTFIEAVESGKNVRVKHDIINDLVLEENDFFREYYNKYVPISILLHNIANYFISDEEIREIILYGKWYVE